MVDKLRLEVLLAAVDKVTGPLKNITNGSRETASAIAQAKAELRKFEAQQKTLASLGQRRQDVTAEKEKLRIARASLAQMREDLAMGKATTAQIAKQEKAVNKQTEAYNKQLHSLRGLRQGFRSMGLGSDAAAAQQVLQSRTAAATAAIADQTSKLQKQEAVEKRLKALRDHHSATMMKMAKWTGAAMGAQLASQKLTGAIAKPANDFMQHEDAMMGVLRQVSGARGSDGKPTAVYYEIETEIRALSTQIPQTTQQIAEMFTAAARMEVPTDKLGGFVKMTSDMATAFDAVPDEIAESMGKIANNFHIPITDMRELADSINYLDDNAISKGADIIGFMNRVGGVAASVKISSKEMAALGSTLLTSGETEETSATAVKAIMTNFAAATKMPKRFQSAVAQIGLTSQGIQTGMSEDAVGTILKIVEAVNKLPAKDRLGVMAELAGKEHVGRMAKLATNTEEFKRQLELANSAQAKGSMLREAEARNSAMSAQLQMLKNAAFNVSSEIGKALKEPFMDALEVIKPWLAELQQWLIQNQRLVKTLMLVAAAVAALLSVVGVLGLALIALLGPLAMLRMLSGRFMLNLLGVAAAGGKAATAGAGVARVMATVAAPLKMIGAKLGVLGKLGGLLRWVFRLVFAFARANPLAAIVLGIGGVAAGVYAKWDKLKEYFKAGEWWSLAKEIWGAIEWGLNAATLGMYSFVKNMVIGAYNAAKSALGGIQRAGTGDDDAEVATDYDNAKRKRAFARRGVDFPLTGDARMAPELAMTPRAAAPAPNITTTNTINVTAAPGMDEKAVARAVSFELDRQSRQSAARWGSKLADNY